MGENKPLRLLFLDVVVNLGEPDKTRVPSVSFTLNFLPLGPFRISCLLEFSRHCIRSSIFICTCQKILFSIRRENARMSILVE